LVLRGSPAPATGLGISGTSVIDGALALLDRRNDIWRITAPM